MSEEQTQTGTGSTEGAGTTQTQTTNGGSQQDAQGSAGNSGATQTTSWLDGLGDDQKSWVQNKGFKDPKELLESYQNFEKLQGIPKERLLRLPESLEDDVSMAPIWEKLGRPKEAKEYDFDIPKELGDEKMADWAKEQFHKWGVSRRAAEGFVRAWNSRQEMLNKEFTENRTTEAHNQQEALKKEWGGAFEQNKNIAQAAADKFGLTTEEGQALGKLMGPAKAMKFLHKLGAGLGEADFVSGNGSRPGQVTPSQARSEINKLMNDTDFRRRLSSGDVDAKKKWDTLHQQASPGEFTLGHFTQGAG